MGSSHHYISLFHFHSANSCPVFGEDLMHLRGICFICLALPPMSDIQDLTIVEYPYGGIRATGSAGFLKILIWHMLPEASINRLLTIKILAILFFFLSVMNSSLSHE